MTIKKKKFSEYIVTWICAVVIGILLFGVIIIISTKSDMKVAEKQLTGIVGYIKNQCTTYNITNLASETKSLIRIIESAQQVERNLTKDVYMQGESDTETLQPDKTLLEQYAEECYLTGIIVLDASGEVVEEYLNDDFGMAEVSRYFKNDAVLNVADHFEKSYAARIDCADGSYVDMAVVGRSDVSGIIMAFYHTPLAYIQTYSHSFQDILSGYNIESDGTVVVTRDDLVIASNDEQLVGMNIKDVNVLQSLNEREHDGEMKMVRTADTGMERSFGLIDRGRDYYVYAYMSEREVFTTTPQNFVFIVVLYAVILLLIQFVRWRTTQKYTEEQMQKEKAYQEKLLEAAQKAESANIAKTEFLQRMSHDIRTPINGIRGMVEIGEYYARDIAKQAECRKKIMEASGLLLELVNEVLDMGKLESGEVVLESRPFNIEKILEEIKDILKKQAQERGIKINYGEILLPHPNLIGSPLHVKRLFMNIMSNAVKYNKNNGTITISCRELNYRRGQTLIEFVCEDTGIGMSEEFQKHIFEPFTQEGHGARSQYAGTGLGMAIAKNLVDKMGGTIGLKSEQGVGTTFKIRIPFKVYEGKLVETTKKDVSDVSLEGMHVLIAEDNELNMEIAEFLLENEGVLLTKTTDGQEVVDTFDQSEPGTYEVILMDVMMPRLDGYEATRQIRKMDREDAAQIPIVAMTANAFAEDRKKAYDAGMNEHITKPLDSKKLVEVLKKYRK